MILESFLAALALLTNGFGIRQALRNAPKASTWFAAGGACLLVLSTRFPGTFEVTWVLLTLAIVDTSAAGALAFREVALKRDHRLSLDVADDAVVRELLHDVEQDERHLAPPDPEEPG